MKRHIKIDIQNTQQKQIYAHIEVNKTRKCVNFVDLQLCNQKTKTKIAAA